MTSPVRHVRALFAVLALALVGLSTTAPASPPTPSPFPVRWELDFDAGPLRLHVDPADGAAYWYFTYVVSNRTERDQVWAPDLVLFTDAGEILESGRNVPTRVTESIASRLGNELLETQTEIIGDLLRGPENARDGLAVWPADELRVNDLTLFVGGISGETARVRHPRTGQEYILRKTLAREFVVRGDPVANGDEPVEVVSDRFVMR